VLGGSVILERDSVVTGDVAVLGGTLDVSGSVRGSLAVFMGSATLNESAVIEGDVATFGGAFQRAPGAVVQGEVFNGLSGWRTPDVPRLPDVPSRPSVPSRASFEPIGALLRWEAATLGWVFSLILIGIVALLVAPRAMARIASAAATQPALSLGVGLLTWVVAFFGGAVLLIACGLGLLVWLVTALALLLGWLAVGLWAGGRLLRALRTPNASSLGEISLGLFVITVLARLPLCIGFLFFLVIGSVGLGAVVLTRFGTQIANAAPQPSGPADWPLLPPASGAPTPAPDAPVVPSEPPAAAPLQVAAVSAPVVEVELPVSAPQVGQLPEVEIVASEPSAALWSAMDDDLEIVVGIGPDQARQLRAAGIVTLADLAAAAPAALAAATQLPVEQIVAEDWAGQAGRLLG
jgi:predicted flap endonuclease-1-like 5' DNA nuclease